MGKRRALRVFAFCKPLPLHGNFQSRICVDIFQIWDLHLSSMWFYLCQETVHYVSALHMSNAAFYLCKESKGARCVRRGPSLYTDFPKGAYVLTCI